MDGVETFPRDDKGAVRRVKMSDVGMGDPETSGRNPERLARARRQNTDETTEEQLHQEQRRPDTGEDEQAAS
jgi:hypothetical protein